jgi:type II secretion system protein N
MATDFASGPLTTEGIEDNNAPTLPDGSETPAEPERSRFSKVVRALGWTVYGLILLFLFTLFKLPDERIKAYVQGSISAALAPKGITFSAEKGYLSIGYGLSYVFKDVTLTFPPPQPPSHVEKITVSPSILPLILGRQGGSLAVVNGDGKLKASFSIKGSQVSLSFDADRLDLGKLGALGFAGVHGGGVLSGSGSVSGDLSVPTTLAGDVDLSLSKVVLDQQTIAFFNVPRVSISEGKIDLTADKGKAVIKTLRLGKPGSSDDIQGSATGDLILGRNWDSSTLNAKVNLKLSDTLMKAFILLDSFLGPGKQGDGSYSFSLSGPLTAPNPVPLAPGAR